MSDDFKLDSQGDEETPFIDFDIEGETEKAWKCRSDRGRMFWLPKSIVPQVTDKNCKGADIPLWFAKKAGLV